jgi:hypothetical protein
MPVLLRTADSAFRTLLEDRYAGFLSSPHAPQYIFDVEITGQPQPGSDPDDDVEVTLDNGQWHMRRGDFRAHWDPRARTGSVRQSANPYSIDSVLRIVHSLLLAEQGGFLLHAASAIRGDRAHIFTGKSGAGKTTLSSMAPPDVTLLTDEVSYIRKIDGVYRAYGTPFAGELARSGENVSAPIAAVHVLVQAPDNEFAAISPADSIRILMGNVLFFAEEPASVQRVFENVCDFAAHVPVGEMRFRREPAAWELIGGRAA